MNLPAYISRIQKNEIEFKKLPARTRTAIVGFLKCDGMLTEECAKALQVKTSTIYYHWQKYQRELADFAKRSASLFIGRYVAKAEHIYKSAKKKGDLGLAWKVENDLKDTFIKLGWIESQPDAPLVNINIADPDTLKDQLSGDMTLLERLEERAGRNGSNGTHRPAQLPRLSQGLEKRDGEGEGENIPGSAD